MNIKAQFADRKLEIETCALFAWLISHQPAVLFSQNKPVTSNQPAVLFSQNKPVTSNQPAVLFSQNKPAPAISHQPTEQAVGYRSANGMALLNCFWYIQLVFNLFLGP
jgi:hypothetical protein